jgi:hypothetical protein
MPSVFEHLSPEISVTFRVNSLPPVKMLLIRPPWTKSAEDLALVVPDTHSGRTLLAAYQWYMAGHAKGDCVPEPIVPVHPREVLQYLFVAGHPLLSLNTLLTIMTPEDLERLGEYPDLSEEELLAEKDLLRLHVPNGTYVTARARFPPLEGIVQDGRFTTQNWDRLPSQMVHSAVFAFWAGGSGDQNPHDKIWIHTKSGSQTLADYLKIKIKTNEVVYPATVATAATVATVATVVPVTPTPQQLLDKATARTAELQAELKLWRQIELQNELNKELEAELAKLKSTLV